MHADFLRFQDFDERAQDGGFAGAGPAGEDREFARERGTNGGALEFMKDESGFLLGPLDGGATGTPFCRKATGPAFYPLP